MVLIIVLAVVVVLVAVAGFVVTTRRRSSAESDALAPTRARPRPQVATPPVAPPADVSVKEPPVPVVEPAPVVETEEEVPAEPEVESPPEVLEAPTFRGRLAKARSSLAGAVGSVLGRSQIDDETWDDLEEGLIRADVGVGLTQSILDAVRGRVKADAITTPEALISAVRAELRSRLDEPVPLAMAADPPTIWLFVGVNGVGKTTTIGKLGRRLVDEGHQVVMAAGDTFRAAAAEQLGTWAERCGAELVRGAEGGDPSAVIFDGIAHAAAAGKDVVLADTAGRLHNKSNLMDELSKVRRVAGKGAGEVTEVLLVLDATTGQNGLAQARQFTEAVEVTGVVLTKLDGSAKGGIVFAIQAELGIPVKLVGLGETAADLIDFDPTAFVDALFDE
jgi:fused signal recognition particle receptor